MQVAKWGHSLAVRLPEKVVEELGLKVGDEVELVPVGERRLEIKKCDQRERALERMRSLKWPLLEGYRFDRDEANER